MWSVNLGSHTESHSFLVIPNSLAPLLRRDLLHKLGACIQFSLDLVLVMDSVGGPLTVLTMALQDEHHLFADTGALDILPHVRPWTTAISGV